MTRLAFADPERLQEGLRVRYPFAIVRERSELARLGGEGGLWYAFRRGLGDPSIERWWERAPASAIIGADRTFVAATDAFATIVEVPVGTLIGLRVDHLANPADPTAAEDVSALWAELVRRGEADGTLRFNRLDGTRREIEYHIVRETPTGDGFRATIRELPPPGPAIDGSEPDRPS